MIPKRLILAIALLTFGSGLAAGKVIQPDDKSGDDIRAAATQFLNDLADGKEKETRAEFAGTGDGAKLLDRIIKADALSDQWDKALKRTFGNDTHMNGLGAADVIHEYINDIPKKTITLSDGGGAASIAPGNEAIYGIELTKVTGKWRVSYPCARHDRYEQIIIAEMDAGNSVIPGLLDRLKKGDFANADAAMQAFADGINGNLQAVAATRPAVNAFAPDTQPAQ